MPETPAGAVCAVHPEREARTVCARCGGFACAQCMVITASAEFCAACGAMTPSFGALADRGARFVANFIDGLAILAPMLAMGIPSVFFISENNDATFGVMLVAGVFLGLAIGCGIELHFQVTHGQSVGKKWLGIKVVRLDGSEISLARLIFIRNVIPSVIGQFCSLIPLIDALLIFGAEQRCLHDYIADTKVIRING